MKQKMKPYLSVKRQSNRRYPLLHYKIIALTPPIRKKSAPTPAKQVKKSETTESGGFFSAIAKFFSNLFASQPEPVVEENRKKAKKRIMKTVVSAEIITIVAIITAVNAIMIAIVTTSAIAIT